MKKSFLILIMLCSLFNVVKADPSLSTFVVVSNFLQNGKIKVYNNGTTEFIASIGASRGRTGTVYETVDMQVVFYMQVGVVEHTLKTITLSSSHFDGFFLKTYNETGNSFDNNLVKIAIPQDIERGEVKVKYRNKDYNGNWPNGYILFNNSSYQTINMGTPYMNESHVAKIQSMGFSTTGIVDFNNTHYLVEGDVLIKKSSLSVSNPVYSVNNDKEHNVYVWVKQAIYPSNRDWDNAISEAVTEWNANPSSDIKLHIINQYGTVAPPHDIIVDTDLGKLSSSQPKAVEYPNGDGKPGGLILVNLDYNHSSSTQLVNNMIHAFGHALGLKHSGVTNSIMVNNNLSSYTSAFPSGVDEPVISSLYPLNVNSIVTPYISGNANTNPNWNEWYDFSYIDNDHFSFNWVTSPDLSYYYTSNTSRYGETSFYGGPGNYQLTCTKTVSKYINPAVATKNVIVQW